MKQATFCWFSFIVDLLTVCSINQAKAKVVCDDFATCFVAPRLKKSLSALKYQLNWKNLEHFINSNVSTNPK